MLADELSKRNIDVVLYQQIFFEVMIRKKNGKERLFRLVSNWSWTSREIVWVESQTSQIEHPLYGLNF